MQHPASLNLLKFVDERGDFDVKAFRYAVDVMITAQDIVVDNSSYPTDEIGRNAHAFRELGLGYANLGATLMALGMPYDSDQGRNYAAAITALMTGEAYLQSARIADAMEPFAGYAVNREPMLGVIEHHRKGGIRPRSGTYVAAGPAERGAVGVGRSVEAGADRRLSQFAGDGDRADRHDRVHDGLRHHWYRARHRADQVQETGWRRDVEDRQRARCRARSSGWATTRAKSRRSSSTSTSMRRSRARRIWRTRICRCSIVRSSRAPDRARSITTAISR